MPDHTEQLTRIERKVQALSDKVDLLLAALAEDEDNDQLDLDGMATGAERDATQPL